MDAGLFAVAHGGYDNRLAQEGSKLHIGMVYSTQRIDALEGYINRHNEKVLSSLIDNAQCIGSKPL